MYNTENKKLCASDILVFPLKITLRHIIFGRAKAVVLFQRPDLILCSYSLFSAYFCRMRKLKMDELNRKTVSGFKEAAKTPIVIVLDNIRSMHNVGSVFRTADAFLIQSVCLCGFTPQPPHRDIRKTALGATETVDWRYYDATAAALQELKESGYGIYAVEQVENSILLNNFLPENNKPLALIFGNEVDGVGEQLLPLTDGCIEIPQLGMKHSLNVSVSAGIVIWDIYSKMKTICG